MNGQSMRMEPLTITRRRCSYWSWNWHSSPPQSDTIPHRKQFMRSCRLQLPFSHIRGIVFQFKSSRLLQHHLSLGWLILIKDVKCPSSWNPVLNSVHWSRIPIEKTHTGHHHQRQQCVPCHLLRSSSGARVWVERKRDNLGKLNHCKQTL